MKTMLTKAFTIFVFTSLLTIVFGLTGCATYRAAMPADLTDFITGVHGVDPKAKVDYLPFNQSWTNRAFALKKYSKLYVAPISTQYLKPGSWVNSVSPYVASEKSYQDEVAKLAEYFHKQIIDELRSYDKNRFQVVAAPEPGALCLELALTEVVFSHPGAYAGSMASPVPGTSSAVNSSLGSSVAFELRLRDVSRAAVMFTAADRRTPPAKVVDLNKFAFTSSAREIVQEWAVLFAKFLNLEEHEKVEAKRFKAKPW